MVDWRDLRVVQKAERVPTLSMLPVWDCADKCYRKYTRDYFALRESGKHGRELMEAVLEELDKLSRCLKGCKRLIPIDRNDR